jgi:uncharacterized membrane protein
MTFDVPFQAPPVEPNGGTSAYGINNRGEVVGSYGTQELLPDGTHPVDAFLSTKGTFVDVAVPGSTFSELLGINDNGVAVGDYIDAAGNDLPIIRLTGGTLLYPPPALSGALLTEPTSISNRGVVVGTWGMTYARPDWRGFIYKDGVYTSFSFPGSHGTAFWGINDRGQIIGRYWDANNHAHGFLLDPDGQITPLAVPGATATNPLGLNNKGQVVGLYRAAGVTHGFLMDGGLITILDVPGATDTSWVPAINDHGQIVGSFDGFSQGFIATPVRGGQ